MLRKCLITLTHAVLLAARAGAEDALLTLEPGDRLRLELAGETARREGRLVAVDPVNRQITVDLGRGLETIDATAVRTAWLGHRRDAALAGALVGAGVVLIPSVAVGAASGHNSDLQLQGVLYLTAGAAALGGLMGLAIRHTEWVPVREARGPGVALTAVAPPAGARGLGAGLRLSW